MTDCYIVSWSWYSSTCPLVNCKTSKQNFWFNRSLVDRISILFIKISRYLSKPRIWKIALFYLAYWPYQKFKIMITFCLSGDSRVIFRNHHKSKFLLSFSSLGDVKRIDPEALLEVFFNIKFRFYVFARHSWFQVSLKNKLFNEGSSPFKTI